MSNTLQDLFETFLYDTEVEQEEPEEDLDDGEDEDNEELIDLIKGADTEGSMLSIKITDSVASKLVIEDGEPKDRLHITLIYFKDKNVVDDNIDLITEILERLCDQIKSFIININDISTFSKNDDDEYPLIAEVKSPELLEFRKKLADELDKNYIEYSKDYDEYIPHITLKYLTLLDSLPKKDINYTMLVNKIELNIGNDVEEFKFSNDNIQKSKIYLNEGEFPPNKEQVYQGPRGGKYYSNSSLARNNNKENNTSKNLLNELSQLKDEWAQHDNSKEAVKRLEGILQHLEVFGSKYNDIQTIRKDNKIVGIIQHSNLNTNDNQISIDEIAISPAQQKQGIGKKLVLDFFKEVLQNKNIKEITLSAQGNSELFWKKLGFTKVQGQNIMSISRDKIQEQVKPKNKFPFEIVRFTPEQKNKIENVLSKLPSDLKLDKVKRIMLSTPESLKYHNARWIDSEGILQLGNHFSTSDITHELTHANFPDKTEKEVEKLGEEYAKEIDFGPKPRFDEVYKKGLNNMNDKEALTKQINTLIEKSQFTLPKLHPEQIKVYNESMKNQTQRKINYEQKAQENDLRVKKDFSQDKEKQKKLRRELIGEIEHFVAKNRIQNSIIKKEAINNIQIDSASSRLNETIMKGNTPDTIQTFLKGYEQLALLGLDYSNEKINKLYNISQEVNENKCFKLSLDGEDRLAKVISIDTIAHELHKIKKADGSSNYKILDDMAELSKSYGETERSTRLLVLKSPESIEDIKKLLNIEILQKSTLDHSESFWKLLEKAIKIGVEKLNNSDLIALREWIFAKI